MKKIVFLSVLCLLSSLVMWAQQDPLQFDQSGKFKIVQFTDVHYQPANPASKAAIKRIQEVLDAEKPQLVVFTGDIIYARPAAKVIGEVLETVSSRKIPFVVTFGNHDDEQDLKRDKLYDFIRTIPGNRMPERGKAFSPDYVVEIHASQDVKQTAALLYCMDSHAYSTLPGVEGYGWISFEQVDWYRRVSLSYTQRNGGNPLPALAFFHIPLPEYNQAADDVNSPMIGTRMEAACSPVLNTGLFAAMRERGDVMGVFVGHDHDNDYTVMWKNILLGFGRFTGGNTEYNHLENGARVFVLQEGQRSFQTWIRTKGGKTLLHTTYPQSYVKDDWRKRPLSED